MSRETKKQCIAQNSGDSPQPGDKRERTPSTPGANVNVCLTEAEIRDIVDRGVETCRAQISADMNALVQQKLIEFNARVDKVEADHNVLSERLDSVEMDQHNTIEAVRRLGRDATALKATVTELRSTNRKLEMRCNDVEQWTRKSAIRVFGIKRQGAGREDCIQIVHSIITEKLKLELPISELEVAHRVSTSRNPRHPPDRAHKPPAIIVKFARRDVRDRVLRARSALKATGITLSEDLTRDNQRLLMNVRNNPNIASTWSWNGKIFAKIHDSVNTICLHHGEDVDQVIDRAVAARPAATD